MPSQPAFRADLLVIGAGVAGLSAALEAARQQPNARVLVVSSHQPDCSPSTAWAQGGMAAAIAPDDSPQAHAADTLRAAAGHADPEAVRLLTTEGPDAVDFLVQQGTCFDRNPQGDFALTREGAHQANRILHAHGDATGVEIWQALMRAWETRPQPSLLPGCQLLQFRQGADGRVLGADFLKPDGSLLTIDADNTILATGGYAGLYARTSVSPLANGLGLALAMLAGAEASDLEFVQFHPTCLLCEQDPLPLISEAVRGEGAELVNELGEAFMRQQHPLGALAPRDIVSRGIWQQLQAGHRVFLDARARPGADFASRFPGIHARLAQAGIDPRQNLIPVTPATHYTMGGLRTNLDGRTTLPGLYACGEVACTGVHGANRLASNSLLEGVVFGRRAGRAALAETAARRAPAVTPAPAIKPMVPTGLRALLWQHAGIIRDRQGLETGLATLMSLDNQPAHHAACHLARGILQAALERKASVGAHFRSDFRSS